MVWAAGSLWARFRGCEVGRGARIAWRVDVHKGTGITIGSGTEVLRNSTFDATSEFSRALRIGTGVRIKENVWCACYGGSIEIGDHVLIGRNAVLLGHGGISIGDWTMIGPNVTIVSSEHVYWDEAHGEHPLPFQSQGFTRERIEIGTNVWIGANSVILGGTRIGCDVVIGAGAVVTSSLEPGFVYAGVPARPVKSLPAGARTVSVFQLNGRLRG